MEGKRRAFSNGPIEPIVLSRNKEESRSAIFLNGKNRRVKNMLCRATYSVLEGQVVFNIEGRTVVLHEGESVEIAPETPYHDESEAGALMISICRPPFDLSQLQVLENI